MSIKIERLNHSFVREISNILMEEIKDEDIHFVTVTDCDITNDLSFCKVYVTVLDSDKRDKTIEALNGAASFIRGQLSQRVDIRHTPELKFIYDESIAYGNKIEHKIEELKETKKDQA
ncbi:MAG: 30S ribosome-binding factor RbfA [Bacilli bacterium]